MPELLTDTEIYELDSIGYSMCSHMLQLCITGDLTEAAEIDDSLIDAWAAIANEYGEAFTELEANRTL
jgi:hypothetical protein